MKHIRLITLLLLFAASHPVRGQFFERNFQTEFYNEVEELRPGKSGEWLFTAISGAESSFKVIYLHRLSDQGDVVTLPLSTFGQPHNYDWLAVPGGFIVTGLYIDCDIMPPRLVYFLDESGEEIWSKEIIPDDPGTLEMAKLLPGPDSSFWIFNYGNPIQYDLKGDSIGSGSVQLPPFTGFTPTPDGRFLTYGFGLGLYSPDLSVLQFALPNITVLKADTLPGGRFVVLSHEKLYLLNADLSIAREKAHNLTLAAYEWGDMAAGSEDIWILNKIPPVRLLRYDTSLALVATLTVPSEAPFQPVRLAADAGRLMMAGNEYRKTGSAQVTAVRATAADAVSFQTAPDAALLDILSPEPPVGYNYPMWHFHTVVFDSVLVLLKNEGQETLNEVTINGILGAHTFICLEEYHYRRTFSGLNLQPGDSLLLELGKIELSGDWDFPAAQYLCLWTTMPNDSLDRVYQNNSVCRTFTVIVSDNEPQEVLPLSISPNPAADLARVAWPGDPGATALVQVYDFTGRLVLETATTSGGEWGLERAGLPGGPYQVVVRERGRMFSGKVVWE